MGGLVPVSHFERISVSIRTMPPLPAVANAVRVDLLWSDAADVDVSTRLHFRYSGGTPTATDCVNLAASIYTAAAAMDAQWSGVVALTGVRVTDLSSPTGGQGEHAQSTNGTRAGAPLPGGSAVLTNYIITRRYRGGKPRSYWPWFSSDDIFTRQTWVSASVTSMNSALATFFAAVIGSSSGSTTLTDHINVSYYDGFTVVTSPTTGRARNVPKLRTTPVTDVISSFGTSVRPASQRRRN